MSTHEPATGVVVLAAGMGTRMKSRLAKVLHPVCGVPMVVHVVEAARQLSPKRIVVVVGHQADGVRAALASHDVVFVDQTELLGTGDAVRRCEAALAGCNSVLVLNGDSPLIRTTMLERLLDGCGNAPLAFTTHAADDRGAFGRVERDSQGSVRGIEERDDGEGGTAERNAGQYVFDAEWLWQRLPAIAPSARGEIYLTVLPSMAYAEGRPAATVTVDPVDVLGVDHRAALAAAEGEMRQRIIARHLDSGVTIADPSTTYIDAGVAIEADVTLLPNCHLMGATRIATGCVVGPGTTLRNAVLSEGCDVRQSVIEDATLGARVTAGPFAHVRGGSEIGDDCELGNYAEVNRSRIGRGVKMHHFSYLGDATVGDEANIAAGVITCNYDGVNKNATVIGRRVLLGSDTMLVAPVSIGDGALTGAGSVVIHDVPAGGRVAGVPARPLPGTANEEKARGPRQ